MVRTANGSYLPGKVFLEEKEFTSVKLFGPDNVMQIIENRQIKPIAQLLSPHNPDEKIAYQQFQKYVDNVAAMGLPVPTLKPSNKNVMDEIRRKSVPAGTYKKVPEFLMLKNGVKARPKQEVVSESDEEEERKFPIRRGSSNFEWVRRSSRRRQPVKRYLDEIVSEQEMTKDQMKRIKQEVVGEMDENSVHSHIQRKSVPRLKIEKTDEGFVSRSREALGTHRVMEINDENQYLPSYHISLQESFRNTIEELRRNLEQQKEDHDREVAKMKEDYEAQIAEAKKMQYCAVCLMKATMYCCFNNSYCSTKCQEKDWRDGHYRACKIVKAVVAKRRRKNG